MLNRWRYEDLWKKHSSLKGMDDTLKDNYKLLGGNQRWFPYCLRLADFCPDRLPKKNLALISGSWHWSESGWQSPKYLVGCDVVGFFRPLLKVKESMLYIKFLKIFEDDNQHSYQDVYNELLQPRGKLYGNDKDTFMSLVDRCMIKEDGKGVYGRKLYRITDLGKEILRIASINTRVHRVLRHFMKFSDDEVWADIISTALTSEDFTSDDDVEIVSKMLDEILCPGSDMQKIGSHFYWCNLMVKCLRTSKEFYELITRKDIMDHINEMAKRNSGFVQLKKMVASVAKKRAA